MKKSTQAKFEASLNGMYAALKTYADAHREAYGSPIGDDGFLGEAWANMAHSLLNMLNGERGKIDGGIFERMVRDLAKVNGVELD